MKRRSRTHRPTGLRVEIGPSIEGKNRVFINLQGNSYTSMELSERSLKSLSDYLLDVAQMISNLRRESIK